MSHFGAPSPVSACALFAICMAMPAISVIAVRDIK
jgi:hypothetical protein